jgi:aspartate aminotransferase-like enzyme
MTKEILMIPGPTPVPPEVSAAMGKPMISHRGLEFVQLFQRIQTGLQTVFQTREEVLLFPAAGTGAMEAALVNLFSPGERLLSVQTGEFGRRFAKIAQIFGLQVASMETETGLGLDPQAVIRVLDKAEAQPYQGVLITHNETSTGVCNDLAVLGKACRQRDILLVVDGVSSVGGLPLAMDEWGLDAVVTASQKALMTPPGLAMVAFSERAWEKNQQADLPRAYWDMKAARDASWKGQTPYTPALSLLYALDQALAMILAEGLATRYRRHAAYGKAVRAGVGALGLDTVARPPHASDTVTAVWIPDAYGADRVRRIMQEIHGVTVAGGQGQLAGKVIRIGHMGYTSWADIMTTMTALANSLSRIRQDNPAQNPAVQAVGEIMDAEGVVEA